MSLATTAPEPVLAEPVAGPDARALAAMDIGVVLLDSETAKVVYQNRAAARLFPDGRSPLTKAHLSELARPCLERGSAAPSGLLQVGAQLLQYTLHPVVGAEVCVVFEDVSEREQLRKVAETVSLTDNLGVAFAGLRHELGNPLNSMKMTLSVLRRRLSALSKAETQAYVDRALAEVGRIEFLLTALKSYSVVEAPVPEPLELTAFLRSYTALISLELSERSVELEFDRELKPVRVSADPRALHQVLTNLVTNALDAMEHSPIRRLSFRLGRSGRWSQLTLGDTGRGIPQEARQRLFRPFFTSKKRGTGLGLVIVQRLMSGMGGHVTVEPVASGGTAVVLSFLSLGPAPRASAPRPGRRE